MYVIRKRSPSSNKKSKIKINSRSGSANLLCYSKYFTIDTADLEYCLQIHKILFTREDPVCLNSPASCRDHLCPHARSRATHSRLLPRSHHHFLPSLSRLASIARRGSDRARGALNLAPEPAPGWFFAEASWSPHAGPGVQPPGELRRGRGRAIPAAAAFPAAGRGEADAG